jgi:hypothetical protein
MKIIKYIAFAVLLAVSAGGPTVVASTGSSEWISSETGYVQSAVERVVEYAKQHPYKMAVGVASVILAAVAYYHRDAIYQNWPLAWTSTVSEQVKKASKFCEEKHSGDWQKGFDSGVSFFPKCPKIPEFDSDSDSYDYNRGFLKAFFQCENLPRKTPIAA